jgi:regulator of protease activity HflC (stomatin/prohibitin superfamily)
VANRRSPEQEVAVAAKGIGITFAVVFLGFMVLASAWHIVPPGHRGVIVTLGKVSPDPLPEGFSLKIPFITQVRDVSVRQSTREGKTEVFSSDLQNIEVVYTVMFRIPEKQVVSLFRDYSGEAYDSLIQPRIRENLKQLTATMRAEDLAKNRDQLKEDVLKRLQESVGELIMIADVNITNLALSKALESAIEQKVIREQEALAKRFELEKAQKDAEIVLVNARAQAESVRISGEALKDAPDVIQLEIARKWNGVAPQSVVTGAGGANVLLPLR